MSTRSEEDAARARPERRSDRKGGVWFLLIFIAALIALAAAIVVFRIPLANAVLGYLAAGGRLGAATAEVGALSHDEILVRRLDWSADPDASASLSNVRVSFDLRELVFERRVQKVRIEDAKVRLVVEAPDKAKEAGRAASGKGSRPAFDPPFDAAQVDALEVEVKTPLGDIFATGGGRLDARAGGDFALDLNAPALRRLNGDELVIEALKGAVRLRLAADGGVDADASLSADQVVYGPFRSEAPAAEVKASGGSWLAVLAGDASRVFGEAVLTLPQSRVYWTTEDGAEDEGVFALIPPQLGDTEGFIAAGRDGVMIMGALTVAYADGALEARAPNGALVAAFNKDGDRLAFADLDDRPLFALDADGFRAAAAIRSFGRSPGDITLSFSGPNTATIDFDLGASLEAGALDAAAWRRIEARVAGAIRDRTLDAEARINGAIDRARIGRLELLGARLDTVFNARLDARAKSAELEVPGGCLALPSGTLRIPSQSLTTRVKDAAICAKDGAIMSADWRDALKIRANGRLNGADAAFSLGETRFVGAPPAIDFEATYLPTDHLTNVGMTLSGGSVTLNKSLLFTDAIGEGVARLDDDGLSGRISVTSAGLRQVGPNAIATPMRVSGGAELAKQLINFDFAVSTPGGTQLGEGDGVHAIATGRGSADFATGPLVLSPEGLQPSDFSPMFTGLISDATGGMDATFNFNWRPGDVGSSGVVRLDDVAFQGPSLAVTRTSGVSGDVRLSSLLPLATPGVQSVRVAKVDLDALQLSDGDIRFELKGDEMVRVPSAAFEWYGGVIGAYDATSPLGVGRVSTELRAANVDFGKLLSQLNVDGLSGEGVIEGDLPLVFEDGRARIENGELRSVGPGVLRYVGNTSALASVNGGAQIAFDALRELEFASLTAGVNGPLDGTLDFSVRFEGASQLRIDDPRVPDAVRVPVIYTMNIKAPALDLIREGRAAVDFSSRASDLVEGLSERDAAPK
ncbi:MAG: YdbH domain-containing protein [Pseudomonadota bacterium]